MDDFLNLYKTEIGKLRESFESFFDSANKENLAAILIEKSVWWYSHPAGPVSAPGFSKRITEKNNGLVLSFGANDFLIGHAIDECKKILSEFLRVNDRPFGIGDETLKELKDDLENNISQCVANNGIKLKSAYKCRELGHMIFGVHSVNVDDFISVIFDHIPIDKFILRNSQKTKNFLSGSDLGIGIINCFNPKNQSGTIKILYSNFENHKGKDLDFHQSDFRNSTKKIKQWDHVGFRITYNKKALTVKEIFNVNSLLQVLLTEKYENELFNFNDNFKQMQIRFSKNVIRCKERLKHAEDEFNNPMKWNEKNWELERFLANLKGCGSFTIPIKPLDSSRLCLFHRSLQAQ